MTLRPLGRRLAANIDPFVFRLFQVPISLSRQVPRARTEAVSAEDGPSYHAAGKGYQRRALDPIDAFNVEDL